MKTIKAISAPAFVRHLETINKLTVNPDNQIYPFDVWEQLNKLEKAAHRITTAECNGEIDEDKAYVKLNKIRKQVNTLLPELKTFFINGDPRGYALKIRENEAKKLGMYQDWGGYGILCPEF